MDTGQREVGAECDKILPGVEEVPRDRAATHIAPRLTDELFSAVIHISGREDDCPIMGEESETNPQVRDLFQNAILDLDRERSTNVQGRGDLAFTIQHAGG